MKFHYILILLIFYISPIYSQIDKNSYINEIDQYINLHEQDSLSMNISHLEASGLIRQRKFKLYRKTIGGFSDYIAFNENTNDYFNYWYGSRYLNNKKNEDLFFSVYFKNNQIVKFIKEIETDAYKYATIIYCKNDEIIGLETNDPNFSLDEVQIYKDKAIKELNNYIKSHQKYKY